MKARGYEDLVSFFKLGIMMFMVYNQHNLFHWNGKFKLVLQARICDSEAVRQVGGPVIQDYM